MRLSLLFVLCHNVFADTYGAVAANANCKDAPGCAGFYRAIHVQTSPLNSSFGPPSTVTGVSAFAVGIQATGNGNGTVNQSVDLAGFKFKTPADPSDPVPLLSFYYGYFSGQGQWDNSAKTESISGSLLEISSALAGLSIYYDRDGTPGFQWALDPSIDIYTCRDGDTYDCLDVNGRIQTGALEWSTIGASETSCATACPTGNYDPNCTVYALTTSATLPSLPSTPVFTITARAASQPILVNGVTTSPQKLKFDVTINVPWSNLTNLQNAATAKVMISALHAGKARDVNAVKTVNTATGSSITFTSASGQTSYYGYTSTVTVDGTTTNVVTIRIDGSQILNFGTGKGGTAVLIVLLQLVVNFLQAFGWVSSATIHSFTQTHPTTIVWDPEVGQTPTETGSGLMLVPAAVVLLLALVI